MRNGTSGAAVLNPDIVNLGIGSRSEERRFGRSRDLVLSRGDHRVLDAWLCFRSSVERSQEGGPTELLNSGGAPDRLNQQVTGHSHCGKHLSISLKAAESCAVISSAEANEGVHRILGRI